MSVTFGLTNIWTLELRTLVQTWRMVMSSRHLTNAEKRPLRLEICSLQMIRNLAVGDGLGWDDWGGSLKS